MLRRNSALEVGRRPLRKPSLAATSHLSSRQSCIQKGKAESSAVSALATSTCARDVSMCERRRASLARPRDVTLHLETAKELDTYINDIR